MSALELADIIGIVSFALSGFLIAIHHKLDILGVFISSFLTALGGGIIRDVISNKIPFVFTNTTPIILVMVTVFLSFIFKFQRINNLESKTIFIVSDSIGLASFAIAGSLIGIENNFNFLGVLMLAFLTAVGGGTIRDILINKIPFILVSEFYASIAIIMGLITYILNTLNLINIFTLTLVFIFGTILRLFAYYKKWQLPKI